jgi:hypothetical protein
VAPVGVGGIVSGEVPARGSRAQFEGQL